MRGARRLRATRSESFGNSSAGGIGTSDKEPKYWCELKPLAPVSFELSRARRQALDVGDNHDATRIVHQHRTRIPANRNHSQQSRTLRRFGVELEDGDGVLRTVGDVQLDARWRRKPRRWAQRRRDRPRWVSPKSSRRPRHSAYRSRLSGHWPRCSTRRNDAHAISPGRSHASRSAVPSRSCRRPS